MATTSLYRALLIVGLLVCLVASNDCHQNSGNPNPEPLDQNYNIPYSPDDFDREALDKARVKTAPEITHLPSKRQEGIKIYSCGGGQKRHENNSCGCNSGRKHSPPTKRQEHNSCGCSSGRKHKPPTKRQEEFNFHTCGGVHKRQEHNNTANVSGDKPSPSPVPVELHPTYPGSDIWVPQSELEVLKQWAAEGKYTGCNSGMKDKLPKRDNLELHPTYPGSDIWVPQSELEVLKQWAAEGKYTGCNSGMKDKLPKRDHLEMHPTYPGSDLAVPAAELQVLKKWAAEGKHPEITANMSKHPLSKRLPPSFESFEDVKKHREDLKEQKQQLSREKALQEDRDSYEHQRIAAIADVDVKIQRTHVAEEDSELPVLLKISITNNSKWKITFCDKTSPISSNAYQMGFFEVISHELRADIGAPANSTLTATQPTWEECSRDLYSGETASTWITFPPPDALDMPKLGSLDMGGKYDVRLTGVWHGIQATGDPEVDPKWDTNEWSSYTHRFSSNTITIEL